MLLTPDARQPGAHALIAWPTGLVGCLVPYGPSGSTQEWCGV